MGDVTAVGAGRSPALRASAPWAVRSAKRCLFGAPDPTELKMHLEKETQRLYERDKTKWNFDFYLDKPMDCGQFTWKKIRREDEFSTDQSGSSTDVSSCEDIVMVQTHITDYMRKRKLSSNQTTSKVDSKAAKRRSST